MAQVERRLRRHVVDKGGSLVVLRGVSARAEEHRRPQSQSDTALRAVMDAVKTRFDPNSILPGLPWSD